MWIGGKVGGADMEKCLVAKIQYLAILVGIVPYCDGIEFEGLKHIKSITPASVQTQSVRDLINRVIGSRANEFNLTVDPTLGPAERDTYKIVTQNGKVQINGSSGIGVAMGFYYYIKYYCNGQYTWAGQQIDLPTSLPIVPSPGITKTSNDRFRYYQNVCTVSYSLVWLNWTKWERHIDWMALQGINLPLAFTGQEAIFQRVYRNLGFTFDDLQKHFGGPAFLAWARMGNIDGWGGPLPSTWITDKLVLQHKILSRMRSLGMIPVLPAFAGHVPSAITRLYPKAVVSRLSPWSHFKEKFSETYLLDFQDPLFKTIGAAFIKEMIDEFGVDHIYNTDMFNEMTPKSSDPSYLSSASKAVYDAMLAADPQAIWLMQGWLFHSSFWKPAQLKALVTGIPLGKMIVLDLNAELNPVYKTSQSFYGQPFIWCMLHNFGGTMELYGALQQVNEGPFEGRTFQNSTMIGVGITPEGIYQNEVMYEFMNENAWRTEPRNITQWLTNYTMQRYGHSNDDVDQAWHILQKSIYSFIGEKNKRFHGKNGFVKRPRLRPRFYSSVYSCNDGHGDFDIVLLTRRPGIGTPRNSVYQANDGHTDGDLVFLTRRPNTNNSTLIWYNPNDLYQAWDLMVKASDSANFTDSDLFRYDLVDITRNSLQVISMKMYSDIIMAYRNKNSTDLKQVGDKFIILLSQFEMLLASDRHFLLANWLEDSKQWSSNSNQSKLYEYNARNQITLWGPNGEIVDYASKQWAGLFADFYKPRWQLFIDTLMNCVKTGKSFDGQAFNTDVLEKVEKPFTFSNKVYTRNPKGDSIAIVKNLHTIYRPQTIMDEIFYNNLSRWSKKNKLFMKNVKRWNRKQLYRKKMRTNNRYVIQMSVLT